MGRNRGVALLLSAMLVCALCVTALPKTALAADGLDLTTGVDQSGTNWDWTASTRTLSLYGMDYTSTGSIAILLPDNSTIELRRNTTNTVTSGDGIICYGILCNGDLTITGGGSLTATNGAATQRGCRGIHITKVLTVSGGSKVTGVGGNASEYSTGIFSRGLTVTDTSEVEGRSGGDAAAEVNIGIGCAGDINVSGSAKLTGDAGAATRQSCGIFFSDGTITGGTIRASSGASPDSRALNIQPNLGGYPSYSWRTAAGTTPFTQNSVRPYVWDVSHTYVEIKPGPGGGGEETGGAGADVPKTGDSAQPWLWAGLVLLAGAGLAISAVLRRKRRAAGR